MFLAVQVFNLQLFNRNTAPAICTTKLLGTFVVTCDPLRCLGCKSVISIVRPICKVSLGGKIQIDLGNIAPAIVDFFGKFLELIM